MIRYNKNKHILTFTGTDEKSVSAYAKKHKLTFRYVVYLAIVNGIAKGKFDAEKD